MKTILIAGSGGQLGRFLSDFLDSKMVVQRTCRDTCSLDTSVCLMMDVTNAKQVQDTLNKSKPDIIINLAAITNVDYCENNREEARSVNVSGLENLIKYSKKDTKIIHISSDYVFDGTQGLYSELDSPRPVNYYGKTKLESENLLRGSRRKFLIIRASGIYSHFLDAKSNFVSWLHRALSAGESVSLFDDQHSNPACVIGLSKFIFQSIVLDISGIIHYGSSNSISRYGFGLEFCKVFNFDDKKISASSISTYNFDAKRPLNSTLSIDSLRSYRSAEIFSTAYSLSKIKEYMP